MKSIEKIVGKLNEVSASEGFQFSKIQEIRSRHLPNRPQTWKPFSMASIKENYAFHTGGRKEFQFNIGQEEIDGKTIFRFGLAFSLFQDRTLHDSKSEFRDQIRRFNSILKARTEYFDGLKMWYHAYNELEEVYDHVVPINGKLFQKEHFIFLGKYFEKNLQQITDDDIYIILELFDYLLPLYKYVQFNTEWKETRVARLCWNANNWVYPSGAKGKSTNGDTHEAIHGYGYEEWLFDVGKVIGKYHYGFLEAIRRQHQAYVGRTFDILLYTINSETKERFFVGEIKDAEVIDHETSEHIKAKYAKHGWLVEMKEQIGNVVSGSKGFSNWKGLDLFNIRFLPANLKVNSSLVYLPHDNPLVSSSRYTFMAYREEYGLTGTYEVDNELLPSGKIQNRGRSSGLTSGKYERPEKTVEITFLHEAISKSMAEELKAKFGKFNVEREYRMANGSKIDIVAWPSDGPYIYEIKTYPSVKASIREAIGQLMEYAHWFKHSRATKLIVVTQPSLDFSEAKTYFQHLRSTYNLPLYYQSFDFENNQLSELV